MLINMLFRHSFIARSAKTCLVAGFCLSVFIGCSATPGPDKTLAGAVLGAGWGAGAGAVIGNQINNTGAGAALGAGFGAVNGAVAGIGLDVAEGTELAQQRELDALKVQVASNHRALMNLQDTLDSKERKQLVGTPDTPQIFFDKDRAAIRYGTADQLQRVAEEIKKNPYIGLIELHGHTDNTGDTDRNQKLSEARARSVAAFLANYGVPMDQIKVVAHGADRPLAANDNEAGRQLNRRVEIVLVR